MSLTVTEVAGNPNQKVVVFNIDADILGENISGLIIGRKGNLKQFVPFAEQILQQFPIINGVTLEKRDGYTQISFSSGLALDANPKLRLASSLVNFFESGIQPILSISLQTAMQQVETKTSFSPKNGLESSLERAWASTVTPVLNKDGGNAITLSYIYDKNTMGISKEVAVIAGCGGCSSSEEHIVQGGVKVLKETLALESQKSDAAAWLKQAKIDTVVIKPTNDLILIT